MRRDQQDAGNGDTCPLDETHGRMFVLKDTTIQWCPSTTHDPTSRTPGTRNRWPLHGLEVAVTNYLATHQPETANIETEVEEEDPDAALIAALQGM